MKWAEFFCGCAGYFVGRIGIEVVHIDGATAESYGGKDERGRKLHPSGAHD